MEAKIIFSIFAVEKLSQHRHMLNLEAEHLPDLYSLTTMTYREFTDEFLPTLANLYRMQEANFDFHSLVDLDLWQRVFPSKLGVADQIQWYAIKRNAFVLDDTVGSLLITYSLPEPQHANDAKFAAMRIDRDTHKLQYYTLRRPAYIDDPWDINQYSFEKKKEIFAQKLQATDSLREFKCAISRLPISEPKDRSFKDFFTQTIRTLRDSIKDIALNGGEEDTSSSPFASVSD